MVLDKGEFPASKKRNNNTTKKRFDSKTHPIETLLIAWNPHRKLNHIKSKWILLWKKSIILAWRMTNVKTKAYLLYGIIIKSKMKRTNHLCHCVNIECNAFLCAMSYIYTKYWWAFGLLTSLHTKLIFINSRCLSLSHAHTIENASIKYVFSVRVSFYFGLLFSLYPVCFRNQMSTDLISIVLFTFE